MKSPSESISFASSPPRRRPAAFVVSVIATIASLFAIPSVALANTFYVSASAGNDSRTLTQAQSVSTPWRTISHALTAIQSRTQTDTIFVRAGTYNEWAFIQRPNLTLKNYAGEKPKLVIPSGDGYGILIRNQHHVTVEGLEVTGGTPEANGVSIEQRSHHIIIRGNTIHDMGGCGVNTYNPEVDGSRQDGGQKSDGSSATNGPDYVTIEGNVIYNCCFWSKWAASAISLFGLYKWDNNGGYHNVVQANRVYGNIAKYPLPDNFGNPKHTDGNGIIVDVSGPNCPATLIQSNLFYNNGGRGIHVFKSWNVDAINNTCYKNLQDPDIRGDSLSNGELTAAMCGNVQFINNLTFGIGGAWLNRVYTYNGYVNGPVTFLYNAYWAGSATYSTGDSWGDPKFLNAAAGDFRCQSSGIGVNTGYSTIYAFIDFDYKQRSNYLPPDRGAYEQ